MNCYLKPSILVIRSLTVPWVTVTIRFFAANLVGPQGTVYGFDIQAQAVENTQALLKANQIPTKNVYLYNISHAKVDEFYRMKL